MSGQLHRCGDCVHGEAHGFNYVSERNGWPVTVWFWCPLKKHHDVTRVCELYEQGENRMVYDDVDW